MLVIIIDVLILQRRLDEHLIMIMLDEVDEFENDMVVIEVAHQLLDEQHHLIEFDETDDVLIQLVLDILTFDDDEVDDGDIVNEVMVDIEILDETDEIHTYEIEVIDEEQGQFAVDVHAIDIENDETDEIVFVEIDEIDEVQIIMVCDEADEIVYIEIDEIDELLLLLFM